MTDKVKRAIGLKYANQGDKQAPTVVAKGHGDMAEAIIELAKESGVLVHEDPYLSEILTQLDLGQEIPETLYYVIAELIAYSYVLQGKTPAGWEKVSERLNQIV
ncbi:EscU/YscU/HrcU family type III secretion system export apparatus switch protein [Alteromonas lipotrueiana]|uniref:EscU/YscU/HrcU family type III secretion system export apparatus switch protein n=1 Tax=Alteromonas lipotrueiana TaxID=2803815 RepID=UPI001C47A738|nr:EscU/YscU/HrcU family type III secretion system export apparatus switch protein [Alteromonas lipotrueiana]